MLNGPEVIEFLSIIAGLDVALRMTGFNPTVSVVMALPKIKMEDFDRRWDHFREFCAKNECSLQVFIFGSHTDPNQSTSLRFGDSRCDYINVYIYTVGWFADRPLSDSLQAIDQFLGGISEV